MRKKNVLVMGLSMALVAVISIGGTLAYLSDTDGSVTNTFTFANNIQVTLDEEKPSAVANETITSNTQGGYDYTNVVPGQELNKAPEFTVKNTVPVYVFAKVTESNNVKVKAYNTTGENGWTRLLTWDEDDIEENQVVYYKAVTAGDGQTATDLKTLFDKVVVDNASLSENGDPVTLQNIKIEVAAIQQAGFEATQDGLSAVQNAYKAATFQSEADSANSGSDSE